MLDVFVFAEIAYESINFKCLVKLPHLDFRIGKVFESVRFRSESGGRHPHDDGSEFFGIADDASAFWFDMVILGIGPHDRFLKSRHIHDRTEMGDALVPESEIRNRSRFSKTSAVLGKNMADVRGRSVTVIGQSLGDDGNSAKSVPFVVNLFDLGRILVKAGAAADGAIDIFGGDVILLRRRNGIGKVGILRRLASSLGSERDEFGVDAKNFPAGFCRDFFLALYYRSASHDDSTVKNT